RSGTTGAATLPGGSKLGGGGNWAATGGPDGPIGGAIGALASTLSRGSPGCKLKTGGVGGVDFSESVDSAGRAGGANSWVGAGRGSVATSTARGAELSPGAVQAGCSPLGCERGTGKRGGLIGSAVAALKSPPAPSASTKSTAPSAGRHRHRLVRVMAPP